MTRLVFAGTILAASPATAQDYGFFNLNNTDFVVTLGFIVFIGILLYYRVFRTVIGMLDKRTEAIRSDLAEARNLREEAQTLLASYERRQREVQEQADRIVANARAEAEANANKAREELDRSIERRMKAAEDQIASAEAEAVREVRNRAVEVAIAAARDVLARQMDDQRAAQMIDSSIETVGQRLN